MPTSVGAALASRLELEGQRFAPRVPGRAYRPGCRDRRHRAADHAGGNLRGRGARALAGVIAHDELHAEYIIPSVFNRDVAPAVAAAVAEAAMHSSVAQSRREPADQPAGR